MESSSRAIDKLKAAFSINKRKHYIVKDAEGNEVLKVYWTPLTLQEREKARRSQGSDDAMAIGLRLMVDKLQDENGLSIFENGDVPQLRRFLPAKVIDDLLVAFLNDKDYDEDNKDEDDDYSDKTELTVKGAKK